VAGRGEHNARLGGDERAQLLSERGNGAVKAERGTRVQFNFAECVVLVEHIDDAELIEIEAHVRFERGLENFWAQVNVFRADERADAGALVALLDLVPPTVDLVAHHGRLFNEERALGQQGEEGLFGAGNATEELPAGKDADTGGSGLGGEFSLFAFEPLAAEAGMDGGQQMLGDWGFSERKKLRFVEAELGALRLGIELADGFNFVAEELDADGAVGFGRVDIEDAAAAGELAGHFDEIHLRVADAGQVAGEHLDVYFFAAPQGHGQAGVVVAVKELEGRRFNRGDEDGNRAGDQFEERGRALLLHVGMGREVFKGKNVVGGQADHLRGVHGAGEVAAGFEQGFERLGSFVVGHDHDCKLLGGPRHQGKVNGPRRCGEARDTSPPRTKAEVPSYAFKTRRVLQLREDFADERENHVMPV
jgi:hypothetical protein